MRRSLGMGRRQHGRDFEQERADLRQGYENQAQVYSQLAEETAADPSLSAQEKRARLEGYRQALIGTDQEYQAELGRLEQEERDYLAEQDPASLYEGAGAGEEGQGSESLASYYEGADAGEDTENGESTASGYEGESERSGGWAQGQIRDQGQEY